MGRGEGRTRTLCVVLLIALTSCGDLPQPFRGRPGPAAERLRRPPPARLDVITPTNALLPGSAAAALATAVAQKLQEQDIPAQSRAPLPEDWKLATAAARTGDTITPGFEILDPHDKSQGTVQGAPVPLRAWAEAAPETLAATAADAAPKLESLLRHIQAARLQADPNSLYNRPARVVIAPVTGATGDGDTALTSRMKEDLSRQGPLVQDDPKTADFTVQGQVAVVPIAGGQVRVEIQWIVTDSTGAERGRIVQLNEIPRDSVAGLWGDVAEAVAHEAAGGVRDVILTQSGRR